MISLNNETLASGSWDKTIKIWDIPTGQLITSLEEEDNYSIRCLLLLNDRITLASGDKKIKLWNIITGQVIASSSSSSELNEHSSYLTSLILLNDKKLASASEDKTIKFWEYEYFFFLLKLNKNSS